MFGIATPGRGDWKGPLICFLCRRNLPSEDACYNIFECVSLAMRIAKIVRIAFHESHVQTPIICFQCKDEMTKLEELEILKKKFTQNFKNACNMVEIKEERNDDLPRCSSSNSMISRPLSKIETSSPNFSSCSFTQASNSQGSITQRTSNHKLFTVPVISSVASMVQDVENSDLHHIWGLSPNPLQQSMENNLEGGESPLFVNETVNNNFVDEPIIESIESGIMDDSQVTHTWIDTNDVTIDEHNSPDTNDSIICLGINGKKDFTQTQKSENTNSRHKGSRRHFIRPASLFPNYNSTTFKAKVCNKSSLQDAAKNNSIHLRKTQTARKSISSRSDSVLEKQILTLASTPLVERFKKKLEFFSSNEKFKLLKLNSLEKFDERTSHWGKKFTLDQHNLVPYKVISANVIRNINTNNNKQPCKIPSIDISDGEKSCAPSKNKARDEVSNCEQSKCKKDEVSNCDKPKRKKDESLKKNETSSSACSDTANSSNKLTVNS